MVKFSSLSGLTQGSARNAWAALRKKLKAHGDKKGPDHSPSKTTVGSKKATPAATPGKTSAKKRRVTSAVYHEDSDDDNDGERHGYDTESASASPVKRHRGKSGPTSHGSAMSAVAVRKQCAATQKRGAARTSVYDKQSEDDEGETDEDEDHQSRSTSMNTDWADETSRVDHDYDSHGGHDALLPFYNGSNEIDAKAKVGSGVEFSGKTGKKRAVRKHTGEDGELDEV